MTLADRLRAQLADSDGVVAGTGGPFQDPRLTAGTILAPAAVLIAITDRPEPGLILTERSSKLRKHAGQVAFPGGRVDAGDADEIAAALREAHEEVALPADRVEVIGTSDRYHTFTGFDIIPVLGVIPPDLPLVPQAGEVESWFEVPLAYALDPLHRAIRSVEFDGQQHQFFETMWEDHRIWGITAAILANLSRRLGYDRRNAA